MKTTKPETSLTRELSAKYNFSKNIFETTAYKGFVSDVLNRSTSTGGYNELIDIKQEGLENNFSFKNKNQKISFIIHFLKAEKVMEGHTLKTRNKYGVNYKKKFNLEILGPFNLNYDYRHVGQVEDWKNGTVRSKVDS